MPLPCVNAKTAQNDQLPWPLDALSNDGDAEGLRQKHQGLYGDLTDLIIGYSMNEGAVNLYEVWSQLDDMAQRRVSRPGIVHGNAETSAA